MQHLYVVTLKILMQGVIETAHGPPLLGGAWPRHSQMRRVWAPGTGGGVSCVDNTWASHTEIQLTLGWCMWQHQVIFSTCPRQLWISTLRQTKDSAFAWRLAAMGASATNATRWVRQKLEDVATSTRKSFKWQLLHMLGFTTWTQSAVGSESEMYQKEKSGSHPIQAGHASGDEDHMIRASLAVLCWKMLHLHGHLHKTVIFAVVNSDTPHMLCAGYRI